MAGNGDGGFCLRQVTGVYPGALFFDADATGAIAQVQLATLSPGLAMTKADILV
jgi:hypothetical protein